MSEAEEIGALVAEFGVLYRQRSAAMGIVFSAPEVAVAYRCADLLNLVRRSGDGLALLRDEVAYERELLARALRHNARDGAAHKTPSLSIPPPPGEQGR
jgi:hypothetical protein